MDLKEPYRVSGPFKTILSKPKRICPRPNAAEIDIDPQAVNVITQLRRPHRAQELVAGISDQRDIVGSFLAPNRKLKNQVLSRSRNFQRRLTRVRWVLPAGHRAIAKIQNGNVSCLHRVSS